MKEKLLENITWFKVRKDIHIYVATFIGTVPELSGLVFPSTYRP